jgi:cellulose synthase/poly-beta-1,6-N-acetylglucosamine synthase-like glycosyltransferase
MHPQATLRGPGTDWEPLPTDDADWPSVSVVLPVYNGEDILGPCIDSLLALDYPPERHEIIAVDNASTDASAERLAAYGDRLRPLFEPRRGAARARNRAIEAARGDIIAFIDADCIVEPGWLKALIEPLRREPEIAGVGGRIRALPGANAIARFGEEIHDHRKAIEVWHPPYIISMGSALRRSALEATGLFDPAFLRGQDTDLSFRLHLAGQRLRYAPRAVLYHRNESTLGGLFREGRIHGTWQVLLYRKYAGSLLTGHPRVNPREYRYLSRQLAGLLRPIVRGHPPKPDDLSRFVFYAGKKLGHMIGSLRFRHIRL